MQLMDLQGRFRALKVKLVLFSEEKGIYFPNAAESVANIYTSNHLACLHRKITVV